MKENESVRLPLVYSCSGCSSAAQMANQLAIRVDRAGIAEMSCIAGVGGDVPSLVRVAKSGRKIIALDGCPLRCVESCLRRQGVIAAWHFTLSEFGVKKRLHADYDPVELDRVFEVLKSMLASKIDRENPQSLALPQSEEE